jgi:hypothetical protein
VEVRVLTSLEISLKQVILDFHYNFFFGEVSDYEIFKSLRRHISRTFGKNFRF